MLHGRRRWGMKSGRDAYKLLLRKIRLFKRLPHPTKRAILLALISITFLLFIYLWQHFIPVQTRFLSDHPLDAFSLRTDAKTESESALASKFVISRERYNNDIDLLRLHHHSDTSTGSKIVALVELRNVEKSVNLFLTAISQIVDSIIVLDDHSSDLTRTYLLAFNVQARRRHKFTFRYPHIEIILNKTRGKWVREELFDRQTLLTVGRSVGGTHFILLDYDEYISSNCVKSGFLRREILALRPGESLYLPWVELWNSQNIHAVLPNDPNMNFLTRRQVVIFADDKTSQFTQQNSVAKVVSSDNLDRDASIHVLRCPRSLCAQPPRYDGHAMTVGWGNVKPLMQCRIIETRFLNLNNALLKSAWYEALGRAMGAKDGLTTGKMVNILETKFNAASDILKTHIARLDNLLKLAPVSSPWISDFDNRLFEAYRQVEMWRAKEILEWYNNLGERWFDGLNVLSMLDMTELKAVVEKSTDDEAKIYHVPQKKLGSLILAINSPRATLLTGLLTDIGIPQVDLHQAREVFHSNLGSDSAQFTLEEWVWLVEDLVRDSFRNNHRHTVFIHTDASEASLISALLDTVRSALSSLRVIVVFGDQIGSSIKSQLFYKALEYATEAGSHLRVLNVPLESFGSAATIHWLQQRLSILIQDTSLKVSGNRSVSFAESVHRQLGSEDIALAPVARLIFSLNVGRCGSRYMAFIFRTAEEPILAVHEGHCPNGECTKGGGMRMQDVSLMSSYDMRKRVKLPLIRSGVAHALSSESHGRRYLASMSWVKCSVMVKGPATNSVGNVASWVSRGVIEGGSGGCVIHKIRDAVYAETNPNFKAWFYDVVLDNMPGSGYSIVVLVVRKYVAAVLKSLFETGFFSTRDGYTWMETAAGVNSRLQAGFLRDDSHLDAVYKLLSYIVNAEAVFRQVTQHYRTTLSKTRGYQAIQFLPVRAEKVYGFNGSEHLLQELQLRSSEETSSVAAGIHDKYGGGGRKRIGHISLEDCARHVQKFIELCGGVNSTVGKLLQGWDEHNGFDYVNRS